MVGSPSSPLEFVPLRDIDTSSVDSVALPPRSPLFDAEGARVVKSYGGMCPVAKTVFEGKLEIIPNELSQKKLNGSSPTKALGFYCRTVSEVDGEVVIKEYRNAHFYFPACTTKGLNFMPKTENNYGESVILTLSFNLDDECSKLMAVFRLLVLKAIANSPEHFRFMFPDKYQEIQAEYANATDDELAAIYLKKLQLYFKLLSTPADTSAPCKTLLSLFSAKEHIDKKITTMNVTVETLKESPESKKSLRVSKADGSSRPALNLEVTMSDADHPEDFWRSETHKKIPGNDGGVYDCFDKESKQRFHIRPIVAFNYASTKGMFFGLKGCVVLSKQTESLDLSLDRREQAPGTITSVVLEDPNGDGGSVQARVESESPSKKQRVDTSNDDDGADLVDKLMEEN